ncbi:glycosyltransferase family 2 protein, partial [Escherichia coli]|nr:glycosyltransferase family 2 protein [Escherichia coli]
DSRIPQYYSPYNVWAYSLLKAVERTDGKVNDFNFYRLYVISYLRYKNFRSYTLSALSEAYKKPSLAGFIKALFAEFNFFVNRVTNKILKNKKESIAASDIIKAYEVLDSFINKNNIKIKYPSQQGN